MRLTAEEQQAIIRHFRTYFAEGDHIWLFGSRADDSKRGGDIDLYIETTFTYAVLSHLELQLRQALEDSLGEQKIDIVFNNHQHDLPIYHIAKETGVTHMNHLKEQLDALCKEARITAQLHHP